MSDQTLETERAYEQDSLQRRYVRLRMDVLEHVGSEPSEVTLNLFPGTDLQASLVRREVAPPKTRIWEGSIVGEDDSLVQFYQTLKPMTGMLESDADFPVFGRIKVRRTAYRVRNVGTLPGVHAVEEIDPSDIVVDSDDYTADPGSR